ncbi:MAG: class II aldolase/adducin family protein [Alphaproteobacteria bacterium]|nr:MAG: class II aldolase/adducin family protein [Alphaproteobacteria bacterium]
MTTTGKRQALDRLVRMAARALGRAGLAHAYGHCSARIDSAHFLVCAARPMALIAPGEAGTAVPVNGPLPDGVLGEVRIHQQIYKRRPEVGGICRTMPPHVMALSVLGSTPRPRHGFGAYFAPAVPLWNDPLLLRGNAQAARLAEMMGPSPAIAMRGNGAVTAAPTLQQAVVLNWYLEDAARVELAVLQVARSDGARLLTADEAARRATGEGRIFERMWDYLCADDPEHM